MASPNESRSRARVAYWLIAIILAGILLYFSLRGIQWGQVWSVLTRAKIAYVTLWLTLISTALVLRALRWRILLRTRAPISFPTAFWATSAGYFGNNFLPARAGELVRTMMVSARSGLPATFVLTTALSERLCDAIALVIISSITLLALPIRSASLDRAARTFAIVGLCGVLTIVLLPMLEKLWGLVLARLPVPESIRQKLTHILEHILNGIRALHDPGRLFRFIAFTCIIWFSDAIGVQVGMASLGLHAGLPVAFLLITALGLGSALPSTPGYVGIYQFVAVSVLMPFGFSRTDAIAYILLFQALQYAVITFWGLLALMRSRGLSLKMAAASSQ